MGLFVVAILQTELFFFLRNSSLLSAASLRPSLFLICCCYFFFLFFNFHKRRRRTGYPPIESIRLVIMRFDCVTCSALCLLHPTPERMLCASFVRSFVFVRSTCLLLGFSRQTFLRIISFNQTLTTIFYWPYLPCSDLRQVNCNCFFVFFFFFGIYAVVSVSLETGICDIPGKVFETGNKTHFLPTNNMRFGNVSAVRGIYRNQTDGWDHLFILLCKSFDTRMRALFANYAADFFPFLFVYFNP